MILRVEYVAEGDNKGQIMSASLCENLFPVVMDGRTPYRIGFALITKDTIATAMNTLNNPHDKTFTLQTEFSQNDPYRGKPIGTINATTTSPWARAIENYPSKVRPAMYRAGTSSFFHNL